MCCTYYNRILWHNSIFKILMDFKNGKVGYNLMNDGIVIKYKVSVIKIRISFAPKINYNFLICSKIISCFMHFKSLKK